VRPQSGKPEAIVNKISAIGAIAACGLVAGAASGQAQSYYDYPWCAAYSYRTKNCGFMTFQQCLATISGVGGTCEPNPFYRPRQVPRRKGVQRRG
jgi:hypothetical protein